MPTVQVTSRGRITLPKEVSNHLKVGPRDRVELDLQPHGRVMLRSARRTGTLDDIVGCLAGYTDKVATIEEINQAAADGWAGLVGTED